MKMMMLYPLATCPSWSTSTFGGGQQQLLATVSSVRDFIWEEDESEATNREQLWRRIKKGTVEDGACLPTTDTNLWAPQT